MTDHDETESTNAGYNDNSECVRVVGPDWVSIESSCGFTINCDQREILEEEFERVANGMRDEKRLDGLRMVFDWIYSGGDSHRGILIRTILWIGELCEDFRGLSQAEIANKFGYKKQSLGRWRHGEFDPQKKPFEGKSMAEAFPFLRLTPDESEDNENCKD